MMYTKLAGRNEKLCSLWHVFGCRISLCCNNPRGVSIMACNDWRESADYGLGRREASNQHEWLLTENMQLRNRAGMLRAMLCGALTVLDSFGMRDLIDYDEAGVTKQQYDDWWKQHQAEDDLAAARDIALAKAATLLTPEELALLKLKVPKE